MAETYKDAYTAAMDGMRCDNRLTDCALTCLSPCSLAYDVLRAIGAMTRMELNEKMYFVTSIAGVNWFYDDGNSGGLRDALNWAHDVNFSNNPACFEVSKNSRGYLIDTLYAV